MRRLEGRSQEFEEDFWEAEEFESLISGRGRKDIPAARVAQRGLEEWKQSTSAQPVDRDGARQRIAGSMDSRVAQEADDLAERLNFLATTGAVAPFVGLFGTVWGIMNSFFQIGMQESSS